MGAPSSSLPGFLVARRCPCCGSDDAIPRIRSSPPGEERSWEFLKRSWFGFFEKAVFLTYARCRRCGLLYAPAYFTDDALRELYGNMPDNSAGVRKAHVTKTQQGYFSFLSEHCDFAGDYLELGPDIGLFTRHVLTAQGHGRLWLFEPNQNVHAELAGLVSRHRHEIRSEMTDFSAIPDGSISTCVMIHVLDHLPHAREVLRQLKGKFTSKARILVVTHDERSLLARLLGRRWPAYCLQHSQLFNSQTTRVFFSNCGFRVLETRKSVNHFPATYLLKHLLHALGLRGLSAHIRGESFAIPLALGNIMTVAEVNDG